jgi:tRNA-uridine 2-sulfurtransferase
VRILVAMSGGVDSSVAAAILVEEGHDVTGVTLKLWGGDSDTGCCSVSDVDDARRVAQQLDIEHLVFNFGDDFLRDVVGPYVEAHAEGRTPNPCIECNRHLKFDRLLRRAEALGFDALATGHHARVATRADGTRRLCRGADAAKDQSYVLYMLDQHQLARIVLPVGSLTKDDVRARARHLGLRTATKPDSQDVCFITSKGGREAFLGSRIPLRPGRVVSGDGTSLGHVDHIELVTIGQRKGLRLAGAPTPRYAVAIDVDAGVVTVGGPEDLSTATVGLGQVVWSSAPVSGAVLAQCSAHGRPRPASVEPSADPGRVVVRWDAPERIVAPGQSVVLYRGDEVLGGGIASVPR